jgi:hypothetical protein
MKQKNVCLIGGSKLVSVEPGKREKLQKEPEADYDRGQSTIGRWAMSRRITLIQKEYKIFLIY